MTTESCKTIPSKLHEKRYRYQLLDFTKPSNEKCERPFAPNKWLHISNHAEKASGLFSLLGFGNKLEVENIIKQTAKKFFIVIAEIEIMSNHYHMKAKAKRKEDLQNFLRVIHAKIAKFITNAKKGQAKGKFWDGLVFSRLLTSAMEELYLKGYFEANRIEREEGKEAREEFLKAYRKWVQSLRYGKDRIAQLKELTS